MGAHQCVQMGFKTMVTNESRWRREGNKGRQEKRRAWLILVPYLPNPWRVGRGRKENS